MDEYTTTDELKELISALPSKPGVYIMKDGDDHVIYVGKAISLKNRVRQYFQSMRSHSLKTLAMVQKIERFETIVTGNEVEALILECNLIKKYKPYYNILLKDDKNFPYVRVDFSDDYPRLQIVRRRGNDQAQYYGPFISSGALREVLDVAQKMFPLRTCKKDILRAIEKKERPCLNYQIGRCMGPCTGNVSKQDYDNALCRIVDLLAGRQQEFRTKVEEEMQKASAELEFERAARLRDTIIALDELNQRQRVVSDKGDNRDVFALGIDESYALVQGVFIRNGQVMGSDNFELQWEGEEQESELMEQFLLQYYSDAPEIPKEVLVSVLPDDIDTTQCYLSKLRGAKSQILLPSRGRKKELVELAKSNVMQSLERLQSKVRVEFERHEGALIQLADALELDDVPTRIEAYDISNIQGTDTVASMVVFKNGRPSPKHYRRFKIKTVQGVNDFASMKEVVSRRLKRGNDKSPGFEELPDLLLIDGGKGQLNAALEAMKETGNQQLNVIGLAKRIEEVFVPNESLPILLKRNSTALHLLQRVRDEAHRFAITYHRKLRTGRTIASKLDNINGIGKKRKTQLIRHFKSIKNISKAEVDELRQVEGMDIKSAQAVYDYFHVNDTKND